MGDSRFKDLLEMGVLFAGSGQAAEARNYFTKALKIDPESAFAWYYLGAVLGDPEKKQYCFSRAVALDGNIHQRVIRAHTQKTPAPPETEQAAPSVMEDPAIDEDEDTGPILEVMPDPVPEIKKENAVAKHRRLSPFAILLSVLFLALILLVGGAYWFLFGR